MIQKQRWYLVGGIVTGVIVLVAIANAIGMFSARGLQTPATVSNTDKFAASPPTSQNAPSGLASGNTVDESVPRTGGGGGGGGGGTGQIAPSQPLEKRIVLKDATMSITVADPAAIIGSISKMAEDIGGWVVTSNSYQQISASGVKLTYGNITIRVPAEKLNTVLGQINSAAVSVDSVNVTGEDVTEQYTDLSSQLTNLQSAESDLRKIMDSATKTEDVLAVYEQLTITRGQVEQIQGKLKFYDQSAAYSSIAVTLSPRQDNKPLDVGGWQPGNTIKAAVESLVHLGQSLVDLLIWLAIVVLPFIVLLYIAYRLIRRFRPKQARAMATIEAHQE